MQDDLRGYFIKTPFRCPRVTWWFKKNIPQFQKINHLSNLRAPENYLKLRLTQVLGGSKKHPRISKNQPPYAKGTKELLKT